jgi:hypothetical protein
LLRHSDRQASIAAPLLALEDPQYLCEVGAQRETTFRREWCLLSRLSFSTLSYEQAPSAELLLVYCEEEKHMGEMNAGVVNGTLNQIFTIAFHEDQVERLEKGR